jgi:hypothetical protein
MVPTTSHRTIGVDPKLPIAAVVAIVIYVLGKFGLDLDPDLAAAIAAVLGPLAGAAGPAARTRVKGS